MTIDACLSRKLSIYIQSKRHAKILARLQSKNIHRYAEIYAGARIIFQGSSGIIMYHQERIVEDSASKVKKILSSIKTKNALTIFLANKTIKLCKKLVVTAGRKPVMTNSQQVPSTSLLIRVMIHAILHTENVVDFLRKTQIGV